MGLTRDYTTNYIAAAKASFLKNKMSPRNLNISRGENPERSLKNLRHDICSRPEKAPLYAHFLFGRKILAKNSCFIEVFFAQISHESLTAATAKNIYLNKASIS